MACETKDSIVVPKNTKEDCGCYTSCEVVQFKDVVGAKTVKDGGHFGDLLAVARANIEDSKETGELTESAAGEVYAQAIVEAMKESVMFELSHGKTQKEIALIIAQTDYQNHKICLERDQHDLDKYIQQGKLSLERDMTAANIRKIDQDIKVMIAQVEKINAEVMLIEHQAKKINQEIEQSKHEILKIDSTTRNLEQQVIQSRHEIKKIDSETALTYQKITESDAQINLINQQVQKIICECANAITSLNSRVALDRAQICKISCDCANTTSLMASQAILYRRQAQGFNDNAKIRKFEIQSQAYAMVFEALDIDASAFPASLIPDAVSLSDVNIPSVPTPSGNACA